MCVSDCERIVLCESCKLLEYSAISFAYRTSQASSRAGSVRYIWGPVRDIRKRLSTFGTATMEALRTQLDNLQWEVNRLDVENRRLREADTEACKLMDLQTELEQSMAEVATLTERVRAYGEQVTGSDRATAQVEGCVVEAARHTDAMQEQLQATEEQLQATQEQLQTTEEQLQAKQEQLQAAQEQTAEREKSLGASQNQVRILTEELERRTEELQLLHAEGEREREAMKLQRYRAMEAMREKWEAREQRVAVACTHSRCVTCRSSCHGHPGCTYFRDGTPRYSGIGSSPWSHALSGYKGKAGIVESTAMSGQLAAAELELQEVREEAKGSKRDKEVLHLEREELKSELALMQVRVRRLEGTGSVEDRCGGLWEAPGSARREREPWRRWKRGLYDTTSQCACSNVSAGGACTLKKPDGIVLDRSISLGGDLLSYQIRDP